MGSSGALSVIHDATPVRSPRRRAPALAAAAAESAGQVMLKFVAADGSTVRRFRLARGEHVVGSDPDAAVRLDDSRVSRHHAIVEVVDDGGVVLTDLDSRNGTFVHGRRVHRTALRGVAVLAFGPLQAVLQSADPARAQVLMAPAGDLADPRPPRRQLTKLATPAARASKTGPTDEVLPLGRLASFLRELLPPLLAGETTADAAVETLATRLAELLPVGRVEVLRDAADGAPALCAGACSASRLPRSTMTRAICGPGGWRLSLRTDDSELLAPAEPLLALALELIALAERCGEPRRHRIACGPRALAEARRMPPQAPPPPAGLSPEVARTYRRAAKVARGDVPVLVLGESGAGKEVLARWIHARSPRAGGPFLAVNCAALPRELLEAELFGIERGVATGVEARPGILERAAGGTVFLDEIGDMPAELQAKLLRVLESTSLFRVGGRQPVDVDVRFLAATNRDLAGMIEQGSFRRDLYHRLAAFEAPLPPLRRRREEIPALAARFFRREIAKHGVVSPGITRAAIGAFVRHGWPGNVRELENEIAKAVLLLEEGEPLDVCHLSERVRGEAAASQDDPLTLEAAVQRAEREAFAVAQAAAGDDPARAMELLAVSRTTYYRKLKELALGE
ncbi:MAG TPA: sigma 54-interacting transcriptional regulator [Thermoanaerobaculia bacterium]|nr:sigma 54-interacting transcriptional regulator [Thermoanaerobaculia bacterium]